MQSEHENVANTVHMKLYNHRKEETTTTEKKNAHTLEALQPTVCWTVVQLLANHIEIDHTKSKNIYYRCGDKMNLHCCPMTVYR